MSTDPVGFDGALYARHTAHHRAHDDDLLADVPLVPGADVLDVGCGTGDLTARVAALVAPGRVLGIDASTSQVRYAAGHTRDRTGGTLGDPDAPGRPGFAVGRAQDLAALVPAAAFDVVLSVATLHWVPEEDQPAVLAGARRALRAGGVLRVDLGGAGQIAPARAVLDEVSRRFGGAASPWCFPEAGPYAGLVRAAGFDVRRCALVAQRRPFADRAALEGWLRSQVLPAYLPTVDPRRREAFTAGALRAAATRLRRDDGSYDQDYVRLDVLAAVAT